MAQTPGFLEFAKSYQAPLAGRGSSLLQGLQTGSQLARAKALGLLEKQQAASASQKSAQEAQAFPLQQQKSLAETQQIQELLPARKALLEAQAQKFQAEAEAPPSTGSLKGVAGDVDSYIRLRNSLPEGSLEQITLDKAYKSQQNAQDSKSKYYNSNVDWKYLTENQKTQRMNELQEKTGLSQDEILTSMNKGEIPRAKADSQAKVLMNTPEHTERDKEIAADQLRQGEEIIAKKIGDPKAREALAPLLDTTKTINEIDMSPISQYTGYEGKIAYALESQKAKAGMGASEDFRKAQIFKNSTAKIIGDQTRQALQTSVRSDYVKQMIMPLADPTIWSTDPETAMRAFNGFKQWLNDRTELYTELATKGVPLNLEETRGITGREAQPSQSISGMSDEELERIAGEEE